MYSNGLGGMNWAAAVPVSVKTRSTEPAGDAEVYVKLRVLSVVNETEFGDTVPELNAAMLTVSVPELAGAAEGATVH